jgi:hypothetical protein
MSTEVAIPSNFTLPAAALTPAMQATMMQMNADATGGIGGSSFPYLSKSGSKFHIVTGKEMKLITMKVGESEYAAPAIQVVVIAANPAKSRNYYKDGFQPDDKKPPTCSSSDGVVPDANVTTKQANSCAECPMAVWGSKISKASGALVPACDEKKQLVVLGINGLQDTALGLALTSTELKPFGDYVAGLSSKGIPLMAVVTELAFDGKVTYPKLTFKFARTLADHEFATVMQRATGDDVQKIIKPVRTMAALPAPAGAPVDDEPFEQGTLAGAAAPAVTNLEAEVAAAEAAVGVGAGQPARIGVADLGGALTPPTEPPKKRGRTPRADVDKAPVTAPPAEFDPYAGLPPHVKLACEAVPPEAKEATYKAMTGQDWPTPPVAAAPAPVDPYAGLPVHVKLACEAVPPVAKAATYKAMTGRDWPEAPAAAPAASTPAPASPPPVVPVRPPVTPLPAVTPVVGAATPATTAAAANMKARLEAALAKQTAKAA